MMLAAAPKVAKLLPRLASEHDGEIVATARAIGRALKASGSDWHDLAAELLQPADAHTSHHAQRPRRARTDRTPRTAPLAPEVLRLLRAGLALDCFTAWEVGFADTILTAAGRACWRPSRKQTGIIARLVSKVQEVEAHP